MAFQDRQAEHLNRKKLTVIDVTKDTNGDIVSLVVDVEREEGTVTVEGTPLNANTLNLEIQSAVEAVLSSVNSTAQTQASYDSSNKVATTAFVWNVLTALGFDKIVAPSTGTGTGSDLGNET